MGVRWLLFIGLLCPLGVGRCEEIRFAVEKPLEELAEAWGRGCNLETTVRVLSKSDALRHVAGGKADVALVSGNISEGGRGVLSLLSGTPPSVRRVGWIAVTLLVHPDNPVRAVPSDVVKCLLTESACGSGTNLRLTWDSAGQPGRLGGRRIDPVVPFLKKDTGHWIVEAILGGEEARLRTDLKEVPTDAAVEREVFSNPAALGLVSRLRHVSLARIVGLQIAGEPDAATPTPDTLASGDYPFRLPIHLAAAKRYYQPHPVAKIFSFAKSEAGQRELGRLGFFSRSPAKP